MDPQQNGDPHLFVFFTDLANSFMERSTFTDPQQKRYGFQHFGKDVHLGHNSVGTYLGRALKPGDNAPRAGDGKGQKEEGKRWKSGDRGTVQGGEHEGQSG